MCSFKLCPPQSKSLSYTYAAKNFGVQFAVIMSCSHDLITGVGHWLLVVVSVYIQWSQGRP